MARGKDEPEAVPKVGFPHPGEGDAGHEEFDLDLDPEHSDEISDENQGFCHHACCDIIDCEIVSEWESTDFLH